jgi:hypothetical protein
VRGGLPRHRVPMEQRQLRLVSDRGAGPAMHAQPTRSSLSCLLHTCVHPCLLETWSRVRSRYAELRVTATKNLDVTMWQTQDTTCSTRPTRDTTSRTRHAAPRPAANPRGEPERGD